MRNSNNPILAHMSPKRIKRFWSRVDCRGRNKCWLWTARCSPQGYGVFCIEDDRAYQFLAHRVAKTLTLGRDLVQPLLRHTCHTPACCNPAHVLEGTHLENTADSIALRGSLWRSLQAPMKGITGTKHPAADYDDGQRSEAMTLLYAQPNGKAWLMQDIAKHIGCHPQTISRWAKEYRQARAIP